MEKQKSLLDTVTSFRYAHHVTSWKHSINKHSVLRRKKDFLRNIEVFFKDHNLFKYA